MLMTAKLTKALAKGKVLVKARSSGQVMIHFGKSVNLPAILVDKQVIDLTAKAPISALKKSNLRDLIGKRHLTIVEE
jgi:hypothetical protein